MEQGADKKTVVGFATAWGTQLGGINAFNFDLLRAIAAGFYSTIDVICVVPHATPEEVDHAQSNNVRLITIGLDIDEKITATHEPLVWEILKERFGAAVAGNGFLWIGHDRITGHIALEARRRGGVTALIHHMSYDKYEHYAEGSVRADRKVEEQRSLFLQADHVIAIGPLLKLALEDLTERDDVKELIPGLANIEPRVRGPNFFRAFLSGRLNRETRRIKQAQLALAGFGKAVKRCDSDDGFPDALKGYREPQLFLRGVDFEKDADEGMLADEAETAARAFVARYADRQLNVVFLPYTTNRDRVFSELRNSSAAIMPSWHEGFGLVAWEAIAAGVPLIISIKSGVYHLLRELQLENLVIGIDPQGSGAEPFFSDLDLDAVSTALIRIAKDSSQWRHNSARLRQALFDKYTWPQCAETFVRSIGWPLGLPTPKKPIPSTPMSSQASASLLEVPKSAWKAGQGLALSLLLRPEEAVVPFDQGALPFLEQQTAWVERSKHQISVRLIVGPGGSGKTRLALEMVKQLSKRGWTAGFIGQHRSTSALRMLAAGLCSPENLARPVFAVIDYAETRQEQLLEFIKQLLLIRQRPPFFRILLLGRSGGEWWQQLPGKQRECESILLGEATSGPYEIPPLHVSPDARNVSFSDAQQEFGRLLECPIPEARPDLSSELFCLPLHLQMAALLSLCGQTPDTSEALTRSLVAHERRYWLEATGSAGLGMGQASCQLMVLATLCGALASPKDAERPWTAAGLEKGALRTVWARVFPLYPGSDGVQGLRPDLLGETLVAESLIGMDGPLLLRSTLASSNTNWRINALTTIARILRSRDDIKSIVQNAIEENFVNCAREICEVIVSTPSPLAHLAVQCFERLAPKVQAQAAGVLRSHLHDDIFPLSDLDLSVQKSICRRLEKTANKKNSTDLMELARELNNLGVVYNRNERSIEGLDATERAVEIMRAVNRSQSQGQAMRGRVKSLHAGCLKTRSIALGAVGRTEEAILISAEAVSIFEELNKTFGSEHLEGYASALRNHAIRQAELGDRVGSVISSAHALGIVEKLYNRFPEKHESALAQTLNNHSGHLSTAGNHHESLALSQRALNIRRRLAGLHPERYDPDLASTMSNYSGHLLMAGIHDLAAEMSRQALDKITELSERKPERFAFDLSNCLLNNAVHLTDFGKYEEAVDGAIKCLEIQRRILDKSPQYTSVDLVNSLTALMLHYSDLGRWDMALATSNEARAIIEESSESSLSASKIESRLQFSWACRWLAALSGEDFLVGEMVNIPEVFQSNLKASQEFNSIATQIIECYENLPAEIDIHAKVRWDSLDLGHRTALEPLMILLCVMLAQKARQPIDLNWRKLWTELSARRGGRVPAWISRAETRFGLVLPH